jgi:organic hydroperoxide reductase OsmC/OhrA
MSEHRATVEWRHTGGNFRAGAYSREHRWRFDGGVEVAASPSPAVVRPPYSKPAHVDPEEAYVAALASCHMLTFLYVASKRGFEVLSYRDDAVGVMTKNEAGVPWVSEVRLRPEVVYGGGRRPTGEEEAGLHEAAHAGCFLANSVKTRIRVVEK